MRRALESLVATCLFFSNQKQAREMALTLYMHIWTVLISEKYQKKSLGQNILLFELCFCYTVLVFVKQVKLIWFKQVIC